MALIELKLNGTATQPEVVTPGTPVPLSATKLLVSGVTVQWASDNTDSIEIKDDAGNICCVLNGSAPIMNLWADDTEADEDDVVWDLNKIFIDSGTAGQKVYVSYYTMSSVKY